MKKAVLFIVIAAFAVITMAANAYAKPSLETSRFMFNMGVETGYMKIDIDGNQCEGEVAFYTDLKGKDIEVDMGAWETNTCTVVEYANGAYHAQWDVVLESGRSFTFKGYIDPSPHRMIAGYARTTGTAIKQPFFGFLTK